MDNQPAYQRFPNTILYEHWVEERLTRGFFYKRWFVMKNIEVRHLASTTNGGPLFGRC